MKLKLKLFLSTVCLMALLASCSFFKSSEPTTTSGDSIPSDTGKISVVDTLHTEVRPDSLAE